MSAPQKNHFIFSVYPLHVRSRFPSVALLLSFLCSLTSRSSLPRSFLQGHTRPLVSIACNLLISHPQLHITLLAGPAGLGLVEKVVAEHTDLAKGDGRLKVVGCLVDRMGLSLEKIWEELDVRWVRRQSGEEGDEEKRGGRRCFEERTSADFLS